MKSKNKQILKVTALYVIWNPKSVKCPASISENPVPLCEDSGFVVSELVVGSNEQDIFSKRLDNLRPVSVKLSSIRVAFGLFFFLKIFAF